MILGNGLAGERVWSASSCPIVSSPQSHIITILEAETGEADAVCVVMCTASHATVDLESNTDAMRRNDSVIFVPDISNLSFSLKALGKEQREDSLL